MIVNTISPGAASTHWTEDEVILVCEAVKQNGWVALNAGEFQTGALSTLLQYCSSVPTGSRPEAFRSPNSIRRKSYDILTLLPDYDGPPTKGGKTTQDVVQDFLSDPEGMSARAREVRENFARSIGSPETYETRRLGSDSSQWAVVTSSGDVNRDRTPRHTVTPTSLPIGPSPHMMESMRSLGYSPEVAVADLIDNSLDAGATRVELRGDVLNKSPQWFWIKDDGHGMGVDEMQDALRLGSRSSAAPRTEGELGRFGLGLKTASFSQARRLALISRTTDSFEGLVFDLDDIQTHDRWEVSRLSHEEISEIPGSESLMSGPPGTLVCWMKLDRLLGGTASDRGMAQVLENLREHVGLVFHRWISPETSRRRPVEFIINARPVAAHDPFFTSNKAVQAEDAESFDLGQSNFTIQSFTLPDLSKLPEATGSSTSTRPDFFQGQGFYIYRNARLISSGGWHGLARRSDASKHSRVRVDLTQDADESWQLDVMKNQVRIPPEVKGVLRRYTEIGRRKSSRVISYRGRRPNTGGIQHVWEPVEDRGGFRYEANPEHPVVAHALDGLDGAARRRVLKAMNDMGSLIPYANIRSRMSVEDEKPARESRQYLVAKARELLSILEVPQDIDEATTALYSLEPFDTCRDLPGIIEEAIEPSASDERGD